MKSLLTFSFLIFFTFFLQAQCPEILNAVSSDGLINNKILLEFDTTFTPDSSANITLDFGTADFRTGYYPVNMVNGHKWETESQGDNFFTGNLSSLIITNDNFCQYNDGVLKITDPKCTYWYGNCKATDDTWREGNVGIGMEAMSNYKLAILGDLTQAPAPAPAPIAGLYVEAITAIRAKGKSYFDGTIIPNSIRLTSGGFDPFTILKTSSEVLTIRPQTTLNTINFDFHKDGTFSSLEIEADEINAKNLNIDQHIQTETISVNDLIETDQLNVTDHIQAETISATSFDVEEFSFDLIEVENLNVTDHLHARKITVKLPPFPDYVFEKDYPIMPLKELEQYIEKYKHLPNIPSAQEVEKNGISIGEFEVKQMEKIEELTLYIIEMNKKILSLENQVQELKDN